MALPEWLEPMAATLTQERFVAPEWTFERKFDGIRVLAYKRGTDVSLLSRNRLRWDFPSIAEAIAQLPPADAILDGEVTRDSGQLVYHVFDVMWLDGDVTPLPLEERRALIGALPLRAPLEQVRLLDHPEPWELARSEGWEGVVAKRRGSPYEHRRSKLWLKMKCELTQRLVVGGFTDPQGSRVGLGALLVGYFAPREKAESTSDDLDLVFAGKVGTGFDTKLLLELRARLDAIEIGERPFTRAVGLPRDRAHWVRPELVVEVGFIEWTGNDKLRHPRLLGIRTDTPPREVVREAP